MAIAFILTLPGCDPMMEDLNNQPPEIEWEIQSLDLFTGFVCDTLQLAVKVSDDHDQIRSVGFYVNKELIARVSSPPYETEYIPETEGFYTLQAIAYDDLLQEGQTEVLVNDINKGFTFPFRVNFEKDLPYSMNVSDTLTGAIRINKEDVEIVKAVLFVNDSPVWEKAQPPYEFTWSPNRPGEHTIYAEVTASKGLSSRSPVEEVRVSPLELRFYGLGFEVLGLEFKV